MASRRFTALLLGAAMLAAAPAAQAQDDTRFNLACRDFEHDGAPSTYIDHRFSVNLETMRVCRRNNHDCSDIIDHGRWLEFSYDFETGNGTWTMFRLYDRQTGWLDQMMRPVGEPGRPFGDSLCERLPYEPFDGMS